MTGNVTEHTGNAWSNLIIPYQHPSNALNSRESTKSSHSEEEVDLRMEEDVKPDVKKKNPYSIEELLKKPDKRSRPLEYTCSGFQQPYGVFVQNGVEEAAIRYENVSPVLSENDNKL